MQDDPDHDPAPVPIPSVAPAAPDRRTAMALIFGIIFLDMMGVGLIAPLTPYITAKFGDRATDVGVLTTAYSAAQFLAAPVMGALSDRFGRRPVLIVSLIGTAIGYFIFASADAFWILVAARILDGVTGGNISTAQAYIGDITPPQDRAKMFGLMGAAFGLGFTLGPAAGAVLIEFGLMAPIFAAGGLAAVAAALVAWKLPETLPRHLRSKEPVRASALNPLSSLAKAMAIPTVPLALSSVLALGLAHAEMRSSLGIYAKQQLAFTERKAALMFAFMGIIAILVQGGLIRVLAKFIKDRALVLAALPIAAVGFAMLPVFGTAWGTMGALALAALGMGLSGPSLNGMVSRAAGERQQGIAMGASQSVSALGLVIGPMIATPLYDGVGPGWPFFSAAVFIVIGWVILATGVRPPAVETK
ncbi:MAG: MFS transporter [Phycisphaerales bacterium]